MFLFGFVSSELSVRAPASGECRSSGYPISSKSLPPKYKYIYIDKTNVLVESKWGFASPTPNHQSNQIPKPTATGRKNGRRRCGTWFLDAEPREPPSPKEKMPPRACHTARAWPKKKAGEYLAGSTLKLNECLTVTKHFVILGRTASPNSTLKGMGQQGVPMRVHGNAAMPPFWLDFKWGISVSSRNRGTPQMVISPV